MKRKLEVQTILALLCALVIAGAWIGIQIAKDTLGVWSESAELHFTANNLLGLGPRSELHCAGAVIGHVRTVTTLVVDGAPRFEITAGVRDEFAAWKFAKPGKVALGVVQSVVSPSVIELEMTTTAGAVQPRKPAAGQAVEEIPLVPDTSNDSFTQIASRISKTLDQFTTVQTGHTEPATMELADAIHNMDEVTASLAGRLPAADEDPAVRPPIDRLVENLATTSSNLAIMTASLDATVGKDGRVDTALDAVNADLQHLKDTIDTTTRTITDLDAGVDSSLGQMNGLVNQIAVTMSTLNGTLDRVGNTFVGRMLIAKPKGATSPTPPTSSARAPRETH